MFHCSIYAKPCDSALSRARAFSITSVRHLRSTVDPGMLVLAGSLDGMEGLVHMYSSVV